MYNIFRKASETVPALVRIEREGAIPLSFAQARMWFFDQLYPENPVYNIAEAFHMQGPLNLEALAGALNAVALRHESLRTHFYDMDGVPLQSIAADTRFPLETLDLTTHDPAQRETTARERCREFARRPFDLTRCPLAAALLLRLDEEAYILAISFHHIIMDGWALGVIYQDIQTFYRALQTRQEPALDALPLRYTDYIPWQTAALTRPAIAEQRAYWGQRLRGAQPILRLPTDRPYPAIRTFTGGRYWLHEMLDRPSLDGMRKLAQKHNATLFQVLMAAWATLLFRFTGQEDIVIGFPVEGRPCREFTKVVGCFITMLVLRVDCAGKPSFARMIELVRDDVVAALDNHDLPFEKIVEEVRPKRDLAHTPIFGVLLNFRSAVIPTLRLSGMTTQALALDYGIAHYDLNIELAQTPNHQLSGHLQYNMDIFEASSAQRMLNAYQAILHAALEDPHQPITAIRLRAS